MADQIPSRSEESAYRVASRNHAVAIWLAAIGASVGFYWWLIGTMVTFVTGLLEP